MLVAAFLNPLTLHIVIDISKNTIYCCQGQKYSTDSISLPNRLRGLSCFVPPVISVKFEKKIRDSDGEQGEYFFFALLPLESVDFVRWQNLINYFRQRICRK